MSTHAVTVVQIETIHHHPNADALDIIPIGGWQVVSRKGQFKVGDNAIYIEPDYVVPTFRPEFSFLAKEGKTTHRLKAIRLRGEPSFGLLIPIPHELNDLRPGDDVREQLGITRYEPPPPRNSGPGNMCRIPSADEPKLLIPKFDLESLRNFRDVFQPDEPVVVTEKVDGANARFVFHNGRFYVGSRNQWLHSDVDHWWSRVANAQPVIEEWCRAHEDTTLYGEVYGPVQSLQYGLSEPRFVAFAAIDGQGKWVSHAPFEWSLKQYDVPMAPIVYIGPYDEARILAVAEQDSVVAPKEAKQLMEGVVIKPFIERWDPKIGRVALKHISTRFWLFDN